MIYELMKEKIDTAAAKTAPVVYDDESMLFVSFP
jgi:hypothetical protein